MKLMPDSIDSSRLLDTVLTGHRAYDIAFNLKRFFLPDRIE